MNPTNDPTQAPQTPTAPTPEQPTSAPAVPPVSTPEAGPVAAGAPTLTPDASPVAETPLTTDPAAPAKKNGSFKVLMAVALVAIVIFAVVSYFFLF